jgi:TonB family protein
MGRTTQKLANEKPQGKVCRLALAAATILWVGAGTVALGTDGQAYMDAEVAAASADLSHQAVPDERAAPVPEEPTLAREPKSRRLHDTVRAALEKEKLRALDNLLVIPGRTDPLHFLAARTHCGGMSVMGLGHWRLPTIGEIASLTEARFVERGAYWTKTEGDSQGRKRLVWHSGRKRIRRLDTRWPNGRAVCVRQVLLEGMLQPRHDESFLAAGDEPYEGRDWTAKRRRRGLQRDSRASLGGIIGSMHEILGGSGARIPQKLPMEAPADLDSAQYGHAAPVSEAAEPLALLAFRSPEGQLDGLERVEREVDEPPPPREVGFSRYKAEAIQASVRARTGALQGCYVRELGAHRSVRGEMTLALEVDPRGRVSRVTIEEDSLGHPAIEACVRRRIAAWHFPTQGGNEAIEVRFRVQFAGGSRGPVVEAAD